MRMLALSKKFVLILLAMVQCFAPLVHAHTGKNPVNHGIHVPGLESYLDTQDAASFKNVNSAWHSEGLLVVVDAGIKNPLDMTVKNAGSELYHQVNNSIPVRSEIFSEHNFSPQKNVLIPPQKTTLSQAPRAPPLSYS